MCMHTFVFDHDSTPQSLPPMWVHFAVAHTTLLIQVSLLSAGGIGKQPERTEGAPQAAVIGDYASENNTQVPKVLMRKELNGQRPAVGLSTCSPTLISLHCTRAVTLCQRCSEAAGTCEESGQGSGDRAPRKSLIPGDSPCRHGERRILYSP